VDINPLGKQLIEKLRDQDFVFGSPTQLTTGVFLAIDAKVRIP